MYKIEKMPTSIELGYTGEKRFRKIEIDMSKWMKTMPAGVPSIVHIRPGETMADAYIAVTTFSNHILTWEITAADLGSNGGEGIAQIWLEEEENDSIVKRGKSTIVKTEVHHAINDASETVPTAQEAFLEQVTALKTATVTAKTAAETAQGKAEEAQDAAERAAGIALAQGGQLKFALDSTTGHLIMSYTDEVPIVEEV